MEPANDSHRSAYSCFRCPAGCVHVVCGNTLVVLSQQDFLSLAQSVLGLQRQLVEEERVMSARIPTATRVM